MFIGIKKKLARLSANKELSIIGDWIKSITNHLYWCVASATDGDGEDIVKCWKSLMDHIGDIHDDCYHMDLSLQERRKKWLTPGKQLSIINIVTFYAYIFIQGAKHMKN